MKILNVSRKIWYKPSQALRGIENHAFAWVDAEDHTKGIRDLSLPEKVAAHNKRVKEAEPLPYAEVAGIVWRAPKGAERFQSANIQLIRQAHEFCANAV